MDRDMRRDKGRRSKSVDRTYGNHRNNKNSNYDDRYEEYKRIEREKALASGKVGKLLHRITPDALPVSKAHYHAEPTYTTNCTIV